MAEDMTDNGPAQEEQPYGTLVAVFLVTGLIACVGIIAAVLVISLRQASVPVEATLRHSSDHIVAAAATEKDLEEAVEMSGRWAKSYIRGAMEGARQGGFERMREQMVEATAPMLEMTMSGRVFPIANGTKCLILERRRSLYRVRITEGPKRGLECWVHKKCVVR